MDDTHDLIMAPPPPKYVKLNLPGAPTMLVTHTGDKFLHCILIQTDFSTQVTLLGTKLLDSGDLIPCHANGEPLEPHETQDGRLVRSLWTWDEDDRNWVSNTGDTQDHADMSYPNTPEYLRLLTCVGQDEMLAKFDEWVFEKFPRIQGGTYTNLTRQSVNLLGLASFDRDIAQPARVLDVINLLERVPDARARMFAPKPTLWVYSNGVWCRSVGGTVAQTLDQHEIEHHSENPRVRYLFGTLVAQFGGRHEHARGVEPSAQALYADVVGGYDSLGDSNEPVPLGETWIPAGDVTRAMLDTCPIWEENTNGHTELWLSQSVYLLDMVEGMWRPLRLAGMDRNGVIAAADMTQAHFDRVPEWQWRARVTEGVWRSWSGINGPRGRYTMEHVGQFADEEWRPASVALGSRHVGEKIDK